MNVMNVNTSYFNNTRGSRFLFLYKLLAFVVMLWIYKHNYHAASFPVIGSSNFKFISEEFFRHIVIVGMCASIVSIISHTKRSSIYVGNHSFARVINILSLKREVKGKLFLILNKKPLNFRFPQNMPREH